MASIALFAAGALAFTPMRSIPMRSSTVRMSLDTSISNAVMPLMPLNSMLIAEGDGGINPVFVLLGALPLVAGAAIFFISGDEEKIAARRADPANASRLGYTAEEVDKMEEMARLRYEGDLKEFNAAVAEAEASGADKPNGLTWLAEKAAKKSGGYFDGGNNERPTMI